MKKVQKMNIIKIIALTRKSDTMNTLSARKNIVKVRKFIKIHNFQNNF